MRIARPKEPDAPFQRRRAPPPQATKLLRYSMASGVVFIVLLAIVFIPRGLEPRDTTPSAILEFTFGGFGRITVTEATFVLDLSNFRAILNRDGAEFANLTAGLSGGNATLAFVDVGSDGKLGPGDYFSVSVPPTGAYRFEVRQGADARLVGLWTWTGAPS
ncbi:MAG: hypothetical protein A3K66_07285 [Euryarchaeota archaeon RBG_16_67_27]|nr:MAG: hypothetical protein A3K66_07285 [Euryarchaeota archaeon RBG_16_67_27]